LFSKFEYYIDSATIAIKIRFKGMELGSDRERGQLFLPPPLSVKGYFNNTIFLTSCLVPAWVL
jgi:hypothetical protein